MAVSQGHTDMIRRALRGQADWNRGPGGSESTAHRPCRGGLGQSRGDTHYLILPPPGARFLYSSAGSIACCP